MSNVLYCDRCTRVFPVDRPGISRVTLEMMSATENNPLQINGRESYKKDLCPDCTATIVASIGKGPGDR